METPKTRYATTVDRVHIAYQVVGDGPFDLVYVSGWISTIDAMWDLTGAVRPLGIQIRAGEVLVSQTVKDLIAGSGLSFEDRGEHELKASPTSGICTELVLSGRPRSGWRRGVQSERGVVRPSRSGATPPRPGGREVPWPRRRSSPSLVSKAKPLTPSFHEAGRVGQYLRLPVDSGSERGTPVTLCRHCLPVDLGYQGNEHELCDLIIDELRPGRISQGGERRVPSHPLFDASQEDHGTCIPVGRPNGRKHHLDLSASGENRYLSLTASQAIPGTGDSEYEIERSSPGIVR
jgi:hypothetical protein